MPLGPTTLRSQRRSRRCATRSGSSSARPDGWFTRERRPDTSFSLSLSLSLSPSEAHAAAPAQARLAVSTRATLHTDSKMAETRLPNPSENPPASCGFGERSASERSHRSASAPTSLPLRRPSGSQREASAPADRAGVAESTVCLLHPRGRCRQQAARRVEAEVVDDLGQACGSDESRNTGDADLPLLLLAVAEVVPDDGVRLRDGRQSCASRSTGGCRRKREKPLLAAFLWMLSQEPDVDPARVPEATGAPIRRHRRRDCD